MTFRFPIEPFKKGIATILSLCLFLLSGNFAQAAPDIPQLFAKPILLPQLNLAPSSQLGRIVDYYNSSLKNSKQVILIQDLHAHYGVQKNIAAILEFLTNKLSKDSQTHLPFALAVEGAEGPIDTSKIAQFPNQKIKQEGLDYLMREGELTGMEYFAAMRGISHLLVGVEDGRYYNAHRELFRKTLENRSQLVEMLRGIQIDIAALHTTIYSQPLINVQEKIDAYGKGQISATEYIAYLVGRTTPQQLAQFPALKSFVQDGQTDTSTPERLRELTSEFLTQVANRFSPEERATLMALAKKEGTAAYYAYLRDLIYKHELFMTVPLELGKHLEYLHTMQTTGLDRVTHDAQELAFRLKMQTTGSEAGKNLVQVEHDLALLLKVADLQATDFEVRAFGPHLNEFIALCHSLLASHGLKTFDDATIRQLISTSIDYYVMALMRNKPMVEHTLALLNPPVSSHLNNAVLVTGGFHTAMLTQLLRERNVSYVVITPTVDQISEQDHELYIKRLAGIHLTKDEVMLDAQGEHFLHPGYEPQIRDDRFGDYVQTAERRRLFRGLAIPAGKIGGARWLHSWLKRQLHPTQEIETLENGQSDGRAFQKSLASDEMGPHSYVATNATIKNVSEPEAGEPALTVGELKEVIEIWNEDSRKISALRRLVEAAKQGDQEAIRALTDLVWTLRKILLQSPDNTLKAYAIEALAHRASQGNIFTRQVLEEALPLIQDDVSKFIGQFGTDPGTDRFIGQSLSALRMLGLTGNEAALQMLDLYEKEISSKVRELLASMGHSDLDDPKMSEVLRIASILKIFHIKIQIRVHEIAAIRTPRV